LFKLTGAGLLVLGAWLSLDRTKSLLMDLISVQEGEVVASGSNLPSLRHLAYGTLGLGALVIMVGILGFCGALKESRYSLVLVRTANTRPQIWQMYTEITSRFDFFF
jgi:hypothetical protein